MFNEKGQIILNKKHSKVSELLKFGIFTPEELNKLCVFTTVRNPFDLILSNYFFELQTYNTFHKGIKFRLFLGKRFYFFLRKLIKIDRTNHYSWIMPQIGRYHFTINHSFEDYVKMFYSKKVKNIFTVYTEGADAHFLKLENIESEMHHFFRERDIEIDIDLPLLSKSKLKNGHYSEHYTAKAKELVSKYFYDELTLFNYQF